MANCLTIEVSENDYRPLTTDQTTNFPSGTQRGDLPLVGGQWSVVIFKKPQFKLIHCLTFDHRRHALPRAEPARSMEITRRREPISVILFDVKHTDTGTPTRKVGGTIDSWCGKCKMLLAHTIEALVGEKPARVSCNTCRSQHGYKAHPPGEGRTTAPRSPKRAANKCQSLLKAGESSVAKTYSPSTKFELGDVLEHPTFGRGVATAVKDGAKIEVLFETGSKTLIHGR